jgi:hypothetical protein
MTGEKSLGTVVTSMNFFYGHNVFISKYEGEISLNTGDRWTLITDGEEIPGGTYVVTEKRRNTDIRVDNPVAHIVYDLRKI